MCVEDGHVVGPAPCGGAVAVSDKNASLNAAVGVAISIVAVVGLLTAVVLYRKRKKSVGFQHQRMALNSQGSVRSLLTYSELQTNETLSDNQQPQTELLEVQK